MGYLLFTRICPALPQANFKPNDTGFYQLYDLFPGTVRN